MWIPERAPMLEPETHSFEKGVLKVSVSNGIPGAKRAWTLYCLALNFVYVKLKASNAEEAKAEAESLLRERLKELEDLLNELNSEEE